MKRCIAALLLFISLCPFLIHAEEGMWLLSQLDQLNLKQYGLKLKPSDIYNPDKPSITDAIVWLGGCSASFVSPEGLIVTNHHCAFGALQRASSEEHDYITDGFLAKTRANELEAIGMNAYVLQEMKDITDDILKSAGAIDDPVERDRIIKETIKATTEAIEGDRDDVYARIADMYNGKQYILFVYKRYQDVRVVYAPPRSIGNYGDEIDNWMWPRHCGDFTFLRAYMAPDGSGARYSPDNVPVAPKSYLKVAKQDVKDGDFTFILGFPGSTTRFRTSSSLRWNLNYSYPEIVHEYKEILTLLDDVTRDSKEGQIRVARLKAGLENTMKNFQGRIESMTKTNFLERKIEFESELTNFINENPDLKQKYGAVLSQIQALYDTLEMTKAQDDVLQMLRFSGTLPEIAVSIYGAVREREKPDSLRNPEFSERNIEKAKEKLHLHYYGYYEPADRAMLTRMLKQVAALPDDQRLSELDDIVAHIDGFVASAYDSTKLDNSEFAEALYDKSSAELEALGEPLFTLAARMYSARDAYHKRQEKFAANITNLRRRYIDALYAWKGTALYPDANGTMRFTYGNVAGYKPADAVCYKPFTTLKGVIEKNTGVVPFNMPPKLQELYDAKDYGIWTNPQLNDICVNFTHRCDITGGNSGSAVMNAKGELIGLAFDGNYEAMSSDWQYDYDLQRTISVDIRYVLFITEKFAGAGYLVKEMMGNK
ncbi:S46 family peptidase [candidate division KSB1 bacterium]|nr:S46 family peptidase [candidate division KSB1 bacterium]